MRHRAHPLCLIVALVGIMADANFENYDENENSEDFEEDEKSDRKSVV